MAGNEAALARLDGLISKANVVAGASDVGVYQAFRAQAAAAIGAIAGEDSEYFRLMGVPGVVAPFRWQAGAMTIKATLEALAEDVRGGYLRRQADLIAAGVFGDLLDMADHLLGAGYYIPAASLIGAVLEDGLKRLAATNNIAVKPRDDISAANNRLAAKGVYNDLVRKQVEVWAAVRNRADHGQFGEFTDAQVRDMHAGVSGFLAERLG